MERERGRYRGSREGTEGGRKVQREARKVSSIEGRRKEGRGKVKRGEGK